MKFLPNALSIARLCMALGICIATAFDSRPAFCSLFALALTTDALDGFFARRWGVCSELGRKLDSAADAALVVSAMGGAPFLWPEHARRETTWLVALGFAEVVPMLLGVARLGRLPCYHTLANKVCMVICPLSLLPLLWGCPWPFRFSVCCALAAAAEELAIMTLHPEACGGVLTLWHASVRSPNTEREDSKIVSYTFLSEARRDDVENSQ